MVRSLSLVSGIVPLTVLAVAFAALAGSVAWGRRRDLRRQVVVALPVGVAAAVVLALAAHLLGWTAFGVGGAVIACGGCIALAVALGTVGWRSSPGWQRAVAGLAVLATTLSAGVLVNAEYQYLPTVGALLGVGPQSITTARALHALRADAAGHAGTGASIEITIPGTRSGFTARPAFVWLPPVWFAHPDERLPVVEMLAGVPGSPSDWTRSGLADQTAQAFADAHDGVAPILVMPDATGNLTTDTECVDSPLGKAETYLTEDVPTFAEQHLGARTDPGSWAVAGLSAGGACSITLALRHTDRYSTFADYSGLLGPTVGEVMQPEQTTTQLFGGSSAAYEAHQPVALLHANRYQGLAGWFEVGSDDAGPLAAQQALVPLAESASIATCAAVVPGGGHDFDTWSTAFRESLPWIAFRLGVGTTPPDTTPATCSPRSTPRRTTP